MHDRHALLWSNLLVALAFCWSCGDAPESVLAYGPYEIVTSPRRVSTGAWPNQGGSPFATREVTDFQVRWRGRIVTAPDGSDHFWRVLRLDGAPRPALLLVTTGFVLVTERDGDLELLPLKAESNSLAEAQWLDGKQGQPGAPMSFGIERADINQDTLLTGGRWLRLGSRIVIDVPTLTVHTVTPWVPHEPGVPITSVSRDGDEVRAFSPGRTQYVLAASGYDYERDGQMAYGLLVVDIPSGVAHELRFDRKRMRFGEISDLDAGWIEHHFAWQASADGGERLVARSDFKPWPWRGRLIETSPARWEYHIPRMGEAFLGVMQKIAAALPGAQVDPVHDDGFEMRIDDCAFDARAFGSDGSPDDHRIAVWPTIDDESQGKSCRDALTRLATALDAELASGRNDGMILLD